MNKITLLGLIIILLAFFNTCEMIISIPDDKTYTVIYQANGGLGDMEEAIFTQGKPQNLAACTFTKPGFAFAGWALSSTGEVVYADEEQVLDLTKKKVISLYAVWTVNSLTINYAPGFADNVDGDGEPPE